MAFDINLSNRVREYLAQFPKLKIEEKKMFGGLAFLVNGKMCVNISGNNLMCRFDPAMAETLAERSGFLPMIMRNKQLDGYCYVEPEGFKSRKDFEYWLNLCLAYNKEIK
ncbi:TfoX N-terminal domain-containing protein [Chitinophaga terrae (ex Kim and Jung 2007)]|uniref:TfoX N-terminal domain-containing protein n=1 Tax=Chitinophaga terrae (ex Kim and Jung 2007) TaxID=408074 RepID=A0A1H4GPW5_9BACT|nr:TfoX/Sxy family protein [Chitinophaga terrae (ex Kim and Jung 2007)]GEP93689.1 hypothetical protein CTE07_53340 [Chitinophaga terrae (ex Kim and Jung 2007)]SEB11577.1 TfoX N-terminal domain-containing protein [Chitinophaga terrae (ex Kim and Jung 2007)]